MKQTFIGPLADALRMDVTILGTGEWARRFARLCVLAHSADEGESSDGLPTVSLYGAEATAVMDAVDAIEDALRANAVPDPAASADRIDGTTDLDTAVDDVDVIIDSRTADVGTRRERLAGLEEHVDPATVIAVRAGEEGTTALAVALEAPGRVVGLDLVASEEPGVVEVVRADHTDDDTVETIRTFVEMLGWRPVVVHDTPGAISQRLQLALEVEAMRAVQTDVAAPADVDAVMAQGFDLEEGPLTSADRAGLDRRLDTLERLAADLGERFEPPAVLRSKVAEGTLGQQTGEGFRVWENDHPSEDAAESSE